MTASLVTPARSVTKSKRKVQHWFDRKELDLAHDVDGMVLIAYCGRPKLCGKSALPIVTVEVVGRLMAASSPRDCRSCVRAYEAYLRRSAARNERWNRLNGF